MNSKHIITAFTNLAKGLRVVLEKPDLEPAEEQRLKAMLSEIEAFLLKFQPLP